MTLYKCIYKSEGTVMNAAFVFFISVRSLMPAKHPFTFSVYTQQHPVSLTETNLEVKCPSCPAGHLHPDQQLRFSFALSHAPSQVPGGASLFPTFLLRIYFTLPFELGASAESVAKHTQQIPQPERLFPRQALLFLSNDWKSIGLILLVSLLMLVQPV